MSYYIPHDATETWHSQIKKKNNNKTQQSRGLRSDFGAFGGKLQTLNLPHCLISTEPCHRLLSDFSDSAVAVSGVLAQPDYSAWPDPTHVLGKRKPSA